MSADQDRNAGAKRRSNPKRNEYQSTAEGLAEELTADLLAWVWRAHFPGKTALGPGGGTLPSSLARWDLLDIHK